MSAEKTSLTAPASKVVLLHWDLRFAVGRGENVFIVVWRDKPSSDGVRICRDHFESICAQHSRKIVTISIIESKSEAPDPQTRRALAELLASGSQRILASALVFEGSGFYAAALRGVVTGISLIARQSYPHRVFESVTKATQFLDAELQAQAGSTGAAREVEVSVGDLRHIISETAAGRASKSLLP